MTFTPKQILCLISVFLLQTSMVLASPDEANTSATQSTSEAKHNKTEQVFTLGELIQILARVRTSPPTPNNITTLIHENRPIDENIANSLRRVLPNYSRLNELLSTSEYVNEPHGIKKIVFHEIESHEPLSAEGNQYVLLVNPDNGDWLWGLLFDIRSEANFRRGYTTVPIGLTRLNNNIYFLPISYFCQESQYGPQIYRVRREYFNGSSKQITSFDIYSPTIPSSEQVCIAKSFVSRQTAPKPFHLVLKYYPTYVRAKYFTEIDDYSELDSDCDRQGDDEDMIQRFKWYLSNAFHPIDRVLRHGGALVLTSTDKRRLVPIGLDHGDSTLLDSPEEDSFLYPGRVKEYGNCIVQITRHDGSIGYYKFKCYQGFVEAEEKRKAKQHTRASSLS